jgi:hypothetical protein
VANVGKVHAARERSAKDRIAPALAGHKKGKKGSKSETADAHRARQDRAAARLKKYRDLGVPLDIPADVKIISDPTQILSMGPAEAVRARLAQLADMARKGPRRDEDGNPLPPRTFIALPGVSAVSMAVRYIDGGISRFIEYVQLAVLNGGVHTAKWWQVYADLTPLERQHAVLDDICCAASVKPYELLSEVVASGMQYGQDMGNLIAASLSPGVIAKMGEAAARIDENSRNNETWQKDRHLFLQSTGFAPAPKNAGVSVQVSANAQAASAAAGDPSVPAFLKAVSAATKARELVQDAQMKQLAAPAPPSAFQQAMQAGQDLEGVVIRRGDEERSRESA